MSFRPTSGYHRVVSFGKKALYVKIALAKCFGQNILHGSLLCHKMLKCNLDPLKDFLGLTREVNQLQKSTLTNLLSWSCAFQNGMTQPISQIQVAPITTSVV